MMVYLTNISCEENATLELMSPHYMYARHTNYEKIKSAVMNMLHLESAEKFIQ